jgi:hypothetical protein
MSPALLVIGPSRSGSSALTAVLSLRGAALPATLMPPGPGNPHGHFEPQRLMELNDEILAAHGIAYWDPIAIPPPWFASAEAAAFTTRIAETITAEYEGRPLPVIKDPRLCRVAPLYIDALRLLGHTPHAIIPLRHPAAAAASLSARDNTPPETAELLQIRELLGAEGHTRPLPRAWSRYDALLTDWRAATASIATTLNLAWPIPPEDAAPAIDAFLAPNLRHHTDETRAGRLARRLYAAATTSDAAARETFAAIRATIEEADRLRAPWQSALRARLAALEATSAAQTAQSAQQSADHAAALAARDSEIAGLAAALETARAACDARDADLATLRASTSWRLTAPLRALARRLR